VSCIFCRIVEGELSSDILYKDNDIVAFRDINPQAPVHVLVIPCKHISGLVDVGAENLNLLGRMIGVANDVARKEGIFESGYRLVINSGHESGQVVPHLHIHILGGRELTGQMG
jgi:histidine triad (HIT) family protein